MTIDYLAALAADTAGHTSTSEAVLFWVLAVVAVVGAIGVVAARKAVYSAMSLAGVMIALAMLYIAQDALFLGIVVALILLFALWRALRARTIRRLPQPTGSEGGFPVPPLPSQRTTPTKERADA